MLSSFITSVHVTLNFSNTCRPHSYKWPQALAHIVPDGSAFCLRCCGEGYNHLPPVSFSALSKFIEVERAGQRVCASSAQLTNNIHTIGWTFFLLQFIRVPLVCEPVNVEKCLICTARHSQLKLGMKFMIPDEVEGFIKSHQPFHNSSESAFTHLGGWEN